MLDGRELCFIPECASQSEYLRMFVAGGDCVCELTEGMLQLTIQWYIYGYEGY